MVYVNSIHNSQYKYEIRLLCYEVINGHQKHVLSKPLYYKLEKPQYLFRRKSLNFKVVRIFPIILLLISSLTASSLDNCYFEFDINTLYKVIVLNLLRFTLRFSILLIYLNIPWALENKNSQ